VSVRFDKLLEWMEGQNLDQLKLTAALNALRSPDLRPRSKSEVNRLVNGQLRFADPFMASEIERLTGGDVTAIDYLSHVAKCAAAHVERAA
jgi:hypothetical protein